MDTFFQEMLGGAGRLQENVGVTLFLKDTDKKHDYTLNPEAVTCYLLRGAHVSVCVCVCVGKREREREPVYL